MRTSLVVTALALCVAVGAAAQAPAAQTPDGQALYRQHCRACHGATGVPPQRMLTLYKNLRALDSAFLAGRSEDSLVAVLRNGVGRDMKSYKDRLTEEQMAAVAGYVRTLATPAPAPVPKAP